MGYRVDDTHFGALCWVTTLGVSRALHFFKTFFFFNLYRGDLNKNGSPRKSLE